MNKLDAVLLILWLFLFLGSQGKPVPSCPEGFRLSLLYLEWNEEALRGKFKLKL
jgi:hypothetical protein